MDDIKEIISYGAKWDIDEHYGLLWLKDSDNTVWDVEIQSAEELHILVHLLQSEKPVYFHTVAKYLTTSMENVGS